MHGGAEHRRHDFAAERVARDDPDRLRRRASATAGDARERRSTSDALDFAALSAAHDIEAVVRELLLQTALQRQQRHDVHCEATSSSAMVVVVLLMMMMMMMMTMMMTMVLLTVRAP